MNTAIRVLLVEDNEGDTVYFKRLLSKSTQYQFEVTHTEYLSSALLVMDTQPIDVVLLDLTLPDSMGIDTAVTFLHKYPSAVVIVTTGYDDMGTASRCISLGAQDYLIKNEIQGQALERTIMMSIRRNQNREVTQGLTQESLRMMQETPTVEDPALALLRGHLLKIVEYLAEVDTYIHRSARSHIEPFEALAEKYGIDGVLKDIRSTLRGERRARTSSVQDLATKNMTRITQDIAPPTSAAEARGNLYDIIRRKEGTS